MFLRPFSSKRLRESYVFKLLFCKKGDEFDFAHYHFKVLEADEFTVEKLRVEDTEFDEEEEK